MDIKQFWMLAKIGWLRRLLHKEYNESRETNNIHHQLNENMGQKNTDTEDWLKMLMYELIKISGDLSLTAANPQYLGEMVIWGTQNIRTGGRQLRAGGINSIAYGRNRDETGITTINHLIIPVGKSIDTDTRESN